MGGGAYPHSGRYCAGSLLPVMPSNAPSACRHDTPASTGRLGEGPLEAEAAVERRMSGKGGPENASSSPPTSYRESEAQRGEKPAQGEMSRIRTGSQPSFL